MKDDHELEAYQHHKEEDVQAVGWLAWAAAAAIVIAGLAKLAGL